MWLCLCFYCDFCKKSFGTFNAFTTTLFCKNKLYKNNEVEISQKIRTNLEHFESGKFKDKKNKNDELYFFKTRYKRMTWMPSKSLKTLKKH